MLSTVIDYIPKMWKAVVAGAAVVSVEWPLLIRDGITLGEWGYLVGTTAAAVLAAWKVKNAGT